jgi:hypothetical protein
MKAKPSFNLTGKTILLMLGVITLAGNMMLATKIWKLWPTLLSMFFSFMDIYLAVYSIFNQFIS